MLAEYLYQASIIERESFAFCKVSMVGAYPDQQEDSYNDTGLLRRAVGICKRLGLPVSEDLAAYNGFDPLLEVSGVDVINILPEYGGRDYLDDHPLTDLTVLCNIPNPDDVEEKKALINEPHKYGYSVSDTEGLRRSYAASAHHNKMQAWEAAIEQSGSKMVVITNTDGLNANDIYPAGYSVYPRPQDLGVQGLIIRNDLLHTYFKSIYQFDRRAGLWAAENGPKSGY